MRRRNFLGAMIATAGGILVPNWGQRIFPMHPRSVLTDTFEIGTVGSKIDYIAEIDFVNGDVAWKYWDPDASTWIPWSLADRVVKLKGLEVSDRSPTEVRYPGIVDFPSDSLFQLGCHTAELSKSGMPVKQIWWRKHETT